MRNYLLLLMIAVSPLFFSPRALSQVKTSRPIGPADGIVFVGMFQADADVDPARTPCQRVRDFFDRSGEAHDVGGERPAVCDKVVDVVAGPADPLEQDSMSAIRAAKVVTDSRGRIVLTEPGKRSVHILDFEKRKFIRIEVRQNDRMEFPYGLAVDAENNVYVTDLERGVIAVFNEHGKFKKYIGDFNGERAFEQPNSIAIDPVSGRIYVADSKRQFVVIFDRDGKRLTSVGKRGGGSGPAEFRLPTEVAIHGAELFVLDKRNRRIQVLDLDGHYKREIKTEALAGDALKAIAVDTRGIVYALSGTEQIGAFDRQGKLLFRFGRFGGEKGEFRDAEGIYIDSRNRLYVSDAGNRRVQIFQITEQASKLSASAQ